MDLLHLPRTPPDDLGARCPALFGRREELDNASATARAPEPEVQHPRPDPPPQETANFSSLIALKSVTSPPTRLVA